VRNEVVLLTVKEQKNILHEISKRKANWIGHILLRNCLLQRVIKGKIKGGNVLGKKNRSREYSKGNKTVPRKVAKTNTEDGHKQDT